MLTAAANTKALWYLTRGTGLATLLLLTASVVLGVTEAVRWASPGWPRFVTAGLHKNVSLLVMVLLVVHIVTSIVDGFVPIRWIDSVVPFVSRYRPVWLGLGAIAFDLLIALVATSLVRQYIGYRTWRVVHWSAYACWPVALLHGFGTGTDTKLGWVLVVSLGCLAAVLAAVWWRLAIGWDASTVRGGAVVASVAAPVLIVAWLLTGPLRAGWARRAGTPATVLAGASQPAAPGPGGGTGTGTGGQGTGSATVTPAPSGWGQPPWTAQLSGTLDERGPDSSGIASVTIDATLRGGASGVVHLVLQGPATRDGGIRMQRSSATLGPDAQPSLYQGRITTLEGTSLVVDLHDSAGRDVQLALQLSIDGNNVAGSARATAGNGG